MNDTTRKVLLVDDESNVVEALERAMFFHADWETRTAASGEAALALLAAEPFDVIVTDMRMPGMDGLAVLNRALERHPTVVRVILSWHTELEAAVRAIPVAQQFLGKPCNTEVLLGVLDLATRPGPVDVGGRLADLVGRVRRVPTLPAPHAALTSALEDPEVPVSDLVAIVGQDPALCAKVLQLANSAFVGAHRHTGDIHIAVGLVGAPLLRTIVQSGEVFAPLEGEPEGSFGRRTCEGSRLVAALVRRIAPAALRGQLVTAAMLRDVGLRVVAGAMPDHLAGIEATAVERGVGIEEVEREVLGFTHAQVSARLLTVWGIPQSLVECVRHDHEPWRAADPVAPMAGMLWIADRLLREAGGGAAAPLSAEARTFADRMGMPERLDVWRTEARTLHASAG